MGVTCARLRKRDRANSIRSIYNLDVFAILRCVALWQWAGLCLQVIAKANENKLEKRLY